MPLVSVIIPVCDVEATLARCLESLCSQSFQDWECICVDDGSTDGSGAVLAEWARRDARIRVVSQANSGAVAARQKAVAAAHGEWALFLDPDDWLENGALESIAAEVRKGGADVIQYGVNVVETTDRPAAQHNETDAYFNCRPGDYAPGDLYRLVYVERSLTWNLIGRVIRMEVARDAFAAQAHVYSINETDAYALFYVIPRMKQPLRVVPARLYNYSHGGGISTKAELSLDEYKRILGKFDALAALRSLSPTGDAAKALEMIAVQMAGSSFYAAMGRLAHPSDMHSAVKMLLERTTPLELALSLAERYASTPALVARYLLKTRDVWPRPSQNAGPLDDPAVIEDDSLIYKGEKLALPPLKAPNGSRSRVAALAELVSSRSIRHVVLRQYAPMHSVWDVLAVKFACGVQFSIIYPGVCTWALWKSPAVSVFTAEAELLRLADAVHVASSLDETVMRAEGIAALHDTPASASETSAPAKTGDGTPVVLWTGRFSADTHPGDAIRVFARLKRSLGGDVRFVMAGSGGGEIERMLRTQAADAGLGDSIEFVGEARPEADLLASASVVLATSDSEGFTAAALNAIRAGAVRGVTYMQPQIEEHRTIAGVFEVAYRDVGAAAEAVEAALTGVAPLEALAAERPAGGALAAYIALVKRALNNLHERRTAQVRAVVEKRDALLREVAAVSAREAACAKALAETKSKLAATARTLDEEKGALAAANAAIEGHKREISRLSTLAAHPPLKTCAKEILHRIANVLKGKGRS